MNKKLLALALSVALIGTGCAGQNNNNQASDENASTETGTVVIDSDETEMENNDATEEIENNDIIKTATNMLGMTSEESAQILEGGEDLYSANGEFFIGREYKVNALGIDTSLFTSFRDDDVINSISMHLGKDNFEDMKAQLMEKLGQPTEVNDTPSEAGYTNIMWNLDGKLMYLYKGYGTVDLQLILPDAPSQSKVDPALEDTLPDTITPVLAETKPYPALRDYIIEAFEIPEDYYAKTKYYYNFVDLNSDGRNEIFAVVVGPYTSGTGGSSALIAFEFEGEIRPIHTFTLINTPIIIDNEPTKGMKDIIAHRHGGGATPAYVRLTPVETEYPSVNSGVVIESLEGIKGRAIIANDLLHDIETGSFLTLE